LHRNPGGLQRPPKEADMALASKLLTTIVLASALPVAGALAQPASQADQAYCKALSDTYTRYIGYDEYDPQRLRRRGLLATDLAVIQCKEGNVSAAIPVLEKKLTDEKFTLPARG
jgi:hypothetical protein